MPVGFKATYNGRETEIDDLLIKREFFGDGGLYSWGLNTYGQLGTDNTTDRSSPGSTAAGLGLNWKDIQVGDRCSAAIKSDGTLWTWGHNTKGELGTGNTTSRSSPGTTAGGGTNWKQISVGRGDNYASFGTSMAAVKTDGTLWTWGSNYGAQLGTDSYTSRSSPGTTVGGGTNWKQVSVGRAEMAAVKTDGTLWTWGYNGSGQLGDGSQTARSSPGTTAGGGTNWKQVAAGPFRQMAAVKTDGTLWTCGYNAHGRLGDGTTTARSSFGTTVGGGTNWKEVGGGICSMAIKTDGTLWTWGRDSYGALGAGTNAVSRSSPGTTAGGGTDWKSVGKGATTGFYCCAAIKTDGTLWTWGMNNVGDLGTGDTTSRSSPGTTAGGGTTWKQVSVGFNHMIGIVDNTI